MSIEARMKRMKVALLLDRPFFGSLLMYLKLVESKAVPTAGTDGRFIYYNPEFIDTLSDTDLLFLLAHEVMHCVFLHTDKRDRRGDRDPHLWNIAGDFVINNLLVESGFKPLEGGLYDRKYQGMNTERVYDIIANDPKMKALAEAMKTLDDHGMFDKVKGDTVQGREWRNRVTQASQRAKMAGKLPAGIDELVSGMLNPKIDFKSYLESTIKDIIKQDHVLYPPNRRYLAHDMYLYGYTGFSIKIVVAIDSSGSVPTKQLQYFLGALNDIMQTFEAFEIDVIAFSSHVHSHKQFTTGDALPTEGFGFEDRGGTLVGKAFEWVSANIHEPIDAMIVLSDGEFYEEMPPAPEYETLWILTDRTDMPKFGTVIPLNAI